MSDTKSADCCPIRPTDRWPTVGLVNVTRFNWQLLFSNQRKRKNGRRNFFVTLQIRHSVFQHYITNTTMILSFQTGFKVWANSVDPDQMAKFHLIWWSTLFVILAHTPSIYSMIKPYCSNIRIITTIFSGVWIFRVSWPVLIIHSNVKDVHNF